MERILNYSCYLMWWFEYNFYGPVCRAPIFNSELNMCITSGIRSRAQWFVFKHSWIWYISECDVRENWDIFKSLLKQSFLLFTWNRSGEIHREIPEEKPAEWWRMDSRYVLNRLSCDLNELRKKKWKITQNTVLDILDWNLFPKELMPQRKKPQIKTGTI